MDVAVVGGSGFTATWPTKGREPWRHRGSVRGSGVLRWCHAPAWSRAATVLFVLLAGLPSMAETATAQSSEGADAAGEAMVLRPGDAIEVNVWPDTELGGEFVVEESGYIHLPYLQEVQAAGMSVDELRQLLRDGYSETMRNPVIQVTPLFEVTVMGEVRQPGTYQVRPTHTLFDVIGMAGGFRREADIERLRVVRPGQVVEYDALRALEEGVDMDAIRLRSGDQILIPHEDDERRFSFRGFIDGVSTAAVLFVAVERISRLWR